MSENFFGVDLGDLTSYQFSSGGAITSEAIEHARQASMADLGVDHSHDLDAWAQNTLAPTMTPEDMDEILNREYGPPGPVIMSPQLLAQYSEYLFSEAIEAGRRAAAAYPDGVKSLGNVSPGIDIDDRRKK
jgi:hypothetical protein